MSVSLGNPCNCSDKRPGNISDESDQLFGQRKSPRNYLDNSHLCPSNYSDANLDPLLRPSNFLEMYYFSHYVENARGDSRFTRGKLRGKPSAFWEYQKVSANESFLLLMNVFVCFLDLFYS